MYSGAPKENENPTILSVTTERAHARKTPFEWSHLGNFEKAEDDSDTWIPRTAEDRAVFQALVDVSRATRGKGVALLENAGLTVPISTNDALKYPIFNVEEDNTDPPIKKTVVRDKIDSEEVFDIIRSIQDPEHPHTLEQLGVVSVEQVEVIDGGLNVDGSPCNKSVANVRFTPTIPHCSMATLIGLCLRVKLLRSLPSRFKVSVQIEPGTHASETAINKQLRDKERVCAALENKHLAGVVNKCIKNGANSVQ